MVCVSRSLASVGAGDLRVFLPELAKYIYIAAETHITIIITNYKIYKLPILKKIHEKSVDKYS